jgi:hypothetical protein
VGERGDRLEWGRGFGDGYENVLELTVVMLAWYYEHGLDSTESDTLRWLKWRISPRELFFIEAEFTCCKITMPCQARM